MRFVLIPGAGGAGWYWHRVVPLLQDVGHEAVAVDLPGDDESAGLAAYVDLTLEACAGAAEVVLVGQSLGGFTAAAAADRLVREGRSPVALALLNAMIPLPGETAGEWWDAVGQEQARLMAAEEGGWTTEVDLDEYFLHDVDPEVAATGEPYQRPEAEVVFADPCPIEDWPAVPTVVIAGGDDRFFPLALQQRVARDRLGLETLVVPGGHLAALSRPRPLVDALLSL